MLVLNAFNLLANNPLAANGWPPIMRFIAVFMGIAIAFVSLLLFPASLLRGWAKRPRRISTDHDAFLVETAFGKARLPFCDCLWSIPKVAYDQSGFYLPGRRLIVIRSADDSNPTRFALGFTPDAKAVWKAFVAIQGIPSEDSASVTSYVRWAAGGELGGSMVGLLAGIAASAWSGKSNWTTILGFVGFLDGICWGGMPHDDRQRDS